MRYADLAARQFYGIAAPLQFGHEEVPVVTLDLDDAVFRGPAGPAPTLQVAGQNLELCVVQRNPGDDRDVLPAPPLGLPPDPDNPVAGRSRWFLPADAPLHRFAAANADPAQFGGVDEGGVGCSMMGHRGQSR